MEHVDPMCSVPVSYLNMLQERGDPRYEFTATGVDGVSARVFSHPHAPKLSDEAVAALDDGVTPDTYNAMRDSHDRMRMERDEARARIFAFEERAGCALEHIPVEKLNAVQDAHVMQSAVDTLKAENARLTQAINATASELCDWRGKYKEAQRELAKASTDVAQMQAAPELIKDAAPYGLKKDGTPKAKPGRKVPRRRRAA